ncbi:MAG: DUF4157 domain-containing protein [Steroidobacteraceae bacterium]|jgi:hypothetical protein
MFAPKVAKAGTKVGASPANKLVPQRSLLAPRPFGGGEFEHPHMLQRSIGNQATLRLLAQRGFSPTRERVGGDHEQEADNANLTAQAAKPGLSWDFSKIPIFPPERPNQPQVQSSFAPPPQPGIIQRKLVVGHVNDPLEYEADRVAGNVMRMPDPDVSATLTQAQLSRKCATCEDEERRQLQTKPAGTPVAARSEVPGVVHEVLRAPGQPLDPAPRRFMERRFGHDFSAVRIHADAQAAEAAARESALAFTVGQHIFFGYGQYKPEESAGHRLLAHELVHTLQQRGSVPPTSDRDEWRSRRTEDGHSWSRVPPERAHEDALEREAESFATRSNREPAGQARATQSLPASTLKAARQSIARTRTPLPSPAPLCGKTLTDIEILPPRARPLEPCQPSTVLVTRINIIGRDATSPSGSSQVFNLHLGYYVDPVTGKYCAIADDSKVCVCGRCVVIGCFPSLQEVVDALIEFAKNALLVLGILLLAWIIAEIIAVIVAILTAPVLVLASGDSSITPSSADGSALASGDGSITPSSADGSALTAEAGATSTSVAEGATA